MHTNTHTHTHRERERERERERDTIAWVNVSNGDKESRAYIYVTNFLHLDFWNIIYYPNKVIYINI